MAMMVEVVDSSVLVYSFGFAHTLATTAHVPIVISGKVLVPQNTKAANVRNAFVYEALINNTPKATGEAWVYGASLYWDATNNRLTTTAAANTLCAYALEPKLSGDTVGGLVHFRSF